MQNGSSWRSNVIRSGFIAAFPNEGGVSTPWEDGILTPASQSTTWEFANPLRDLAYMPGRVNAIPTRLLALVGHLVGGLAATEATLDDVLPAAANRAAVLGVQRRCSRRRHAAADPRHRALLRPRVVAVHRCSARVAVHALQCTRTCFNFVAPHGAWWLARPPSPNGSAWGGAKPSAGWRSPRGHTDCVARRVFEVVLFFFRKT